MLGTDRPAAVGTGRLAARGPRRRPYVEAGGERVDCLMRLFNGSVLVLCKRRDERLRPHTGEVPLRNARLVAVSLAPSVIDGAVEPSVGDRRP